MCLCSGPHWCKCWRHGSTRPGPEFVRTCSKKFFMCCVELQLVKSSRNAVNWNKYEAIFIVITYMTSGRSVLWHQLVFWFGGTLTMTPRLTVALMCWIWKCWTDCYKLCRTSAICISVCQWKKQCDLSKRLLLGAQYLNKSQVKLHIETRKRQKGKYWVTLEISAMK